MKNFREHKIMKKGIMEKKYKIKKLLCRLDCEFIIISLNRHPILGTFSNSIGRFGTLDITVERRTRKALGNR